MGMWKRGLAGVLVVGVVGIFGFGVGGCGVSREMGRVAGVEVRALENMPGDEAGVREELVRQAEVWDRMAGLVRGRELGGIPVDAGFVALVEETAALARREKELVEAGEDRRGREVLEKLRGIWGKVAGYLNDE